MRWILVILTAALVACGGDPGQTDGTPLPKYVTGHCGPDATQKHCPPGDMCCAPGDISHVLICKKTWLWKCYEGGLTRSGGGCNSNYDCPESRYGKGDTCQEVEPDRWRCARVE